MLEPKRRLIQSCNVAVAHVTHNPVQYVQFITTTFDQFAFQILLFQQQQQPSHVPPGHYTSSAKLLTITQRLVEYPTYCSLHNSLSR